MDDGRAPAELRAVEPAARTLPGRVWQSGRLALGTATLAFAVATVVPLVYVQRVHGLSARVGATALEMITQEGPYGRELKSTILLALPGAAMGLLSFLWSRRTRAVMLASRPLVLVVSVLPSLAVALQALKLGKHHRFEYGFGPAAVLVALGTVMGVVGAVQFGRGVRDVEPRAHDDDDED